MRRVLSPCFSLILFSFLAAVSAASSQSDYKVVTVVDGGTVSGTVKWSGLVPHALNFPVTKDPQICDPESKKTADLERLAIGPQGGIANQIVYLKDVSRARDMDYAEKRARL